MLPVLSGEKKDRFGPNHRLRDPVWLYYLTPAKYSMPTNQAPLHFPAWAPKAVPTPPRNQLEEVGVLHKSLAKDDVEIRTKQFDSSETEDQYNNDVAFIKNVRIL
ncbi:hypothetical protein PoB_001518600 [Plakobranchus ocellatus]|uniref:Uncharacterized protein n=1 Tax=Plakobranchus ocellatus TaxID=259542 RepID=A0AAV3YYP8_9GAST|nr:hypothetical protein PoB_001518600 [Plakobranchus ocellatus]